MFATSNNNTVFQWMDGTDIETDIIDNLWCDQYPIMQEVDLNNSYVYINGSCFQNTYDSSLVITHSICGPRRFVTTADLIIDCILPGLVLLFLFVLSLIIFKSFCYHFGFDHNWVTSDEPTKAIKCTAILTSIAAFISSCCGVIYCVLYVILWKKYDMIIPTDLPPSDFFPVGYYVAFVFIFVGGVICVFIPVTGYIHVCLLFDQQTSPSSNNWKTKNIT